MPNRSELWRAVWPAALVGVAWMTTGVARDYPLPLLALALALVSVTALCTRLAAPVAVYLSLFAILLRFSQPVAWVVGGVLLFSVAVLSFSARMGLSKTGRWLVVGLALSLPLANLSGGAGSAMGWEQQFASWFHLNTSQADLAVKFVRKIIHFSAYGTIGLTVGLASLGQRSLKVAILIGAIWVAGHAGFDELRQSGTPGRTGSAEDFALDMFGAATFLTALALQQRKHHDQS